MKGKVLFLSKVLCNRIIKREYLKSLQDGRIIICTILTNAEVFKVSGILQGREISREVKLIAKLFCSSILTWLYM